MISEQNKNERYKISAAQKAVIYDEHEKKFLLVKASQPSKDFLEKYGEWEFPGGKLEEDENLEEGLRREIKEEIGDIEYEFVCPLSIKKLPINSGNVIMIDYLLKYESGEIRLSEEHKEFRWETAENIEKSSEYEEWIKKLIRKADLHLKQNEYLEGWRRCQADFENYRKRQSAAAKDMAQYACQNMAVDILPVLDNFHASTEHIPEDQKENPWVTGIMYIQKQLEKVLEDNGVKEIVIKEGDEFDPEIMEAVKSDSNDTNEHSNDSNENKVKKVVQKGYRIGERVLRAARVTVK